MPLKKNVTLVKPPEGSTLIHEESEDMSFRMSQLEKNFKGVVKTLDLYNMEKKLETNMGDIEKKLEESIETNMGNMEKKMEKLEESMERIVNLIQHDRKRFLMMIRWTKVLMMKEIVLILRNHPLVSLLLEGSILTLEVIRDGSQGVFNFPRLT